MHSTEVLYPFSFVWKCRFHKLCLFINPLELKEDSRHYCKIICLSLWMSPTHKLPFWFYRELSSWKNPILIYNFPIMYSCHTQLFIYHLFIFFSLQRKSLLKFPYTFYIHNQKNNRFIQKIKLHNLLLLCSFYLLGVTFKTSPRLKIEKLIKNQTVFLSVYRNEITNSWTLKQLDVKLATSS